MRFCSYRQLLHDYASKCEDSKSQDCIQKFFVELKEWKELSAPQYGLYSQVMLLLLDLCRFGSISLPA